MKSKAGVGVSVGVDEGKGVCGCKEEGDLSVGVGV